MITTIIQGYTKDAGQLQDMALEQLIRPKIPSYIGKMQSAWNSLAQIRNIYMHANTSIHLQHTHHSSFHSLQHTGRNSSATVSHATRLTQYSGRKSNKYGLNACNKEYLRMPGGVATSAHD